jgi:2-amino-4-hydroxy-6-hydroxymethyldihydropteridine diphosphokinase
VEPSQLKSPLIDAYIGIGSNEGRRRENCLLAVKMLEGEVLHDTIVRAVSNMHETTPWGVTDQRDFINLCVHITTTLQPRELLAGLKRIEEIIGRAKTYRWGPRVIDLDILLYGGEIINDDELVIPHPHMHERLFVLKPLCEIAPEARHPGLGMTVREMLDALGD